MKGSRNDPYPTLTACVTAIRDDAQSGLSKLYRGEPALYPHTYSLIYRLIYEQQLLPETELEYLVNSLDEIQKKLNIVLNAVPMFPTAEEALQSAQADSVHPIEIAGAFLQHYYLPTPLLDITDNLDIAAKFAAGGPDATGGLGCLYVIDVEGLIRTGRQVISLKRSNARRPREQHAHSILLKAGEDLQDESKFPPMIVDRHYFVSSTAERKSYFDETLMLAEGDVAAKEVGSCCSSVIRRDWDSCNDDQKRVLRYYDSVCGLLIQDGAHLTN